MAVEDDTPAPPTPRDAGAMLAAAREAAGLSIDAVAGQLKLAPRQVRAIEAGDFAALPGRTFVRGFARNYARLLGLDAASAIGPALLTALVLGLGAPGWVVLAAGFAMAGLLGPVVTRWAEQERLSGRAAPPSTAASSAP